jgi:hypothetical protein
MKQTLSKDLSSVVVVLGIVTAYLIIDKYYLKK